jgi:hypothetical protein
VDKGGVRRIVRRPFDSARHAGRSAAGVEARISSTEDTWPLPDYDNGPPKHVHAIGVIALAYATLQNAMDHLFLNRARSEWAEKYYYLLNEEKRSDASRRYSKTEIRG